MHKLEKSSEDSQPVIRISALHKYYRNQGMEYHALKEVDFSVKKGEYVSVIGPSGSGKSTLLHVMGLFDDFDSGSYFLDGLDVKMLSESEKAKIRSRKIGFVFQMFYLVPSMSVLDNIILPGLLIDKERKLLENKAMQLAERFGISEVLQKTPNKISGGQMQRVAITRALINEPSLILADEPTGNLDSKSGSAVLELFDQLNKEGKTIVMITHDMNIARRSQRTVRILDGRLSDFRHGEGGDDADLAKTRQPKKETHPDVKRKGQ